MSPKILFSLLCLFPISALAQLTIPDILEMFNNNTVDYIRVDDVANSKNLVILDARERVEFEISHLQDAVWVGYDDFSLERVAFVPNKSTPIIIYCSVGVRSEDIGEKFKLAGYTQVKNLYGGIFEWINKGYTVFDMEQRPTEKVHPFSKYWGLLLTKGEKTYETKDSTLEK
nr:rhodanese-like domain-containing protein [Allomuricauda sp.]